jgi:Protein of unknown function (DUF3048).
MKKCIALLLCCISIFLLVSCGGDAEIQLTEEQAWEALTSTDYGVVAVTAEKTAYNYLTGENNMAKDRVGLRPYCISVNNIDASWPQRGTSAADVIIEMETEGGITRLMCLYTDTREVSLIGSVRSLRDQFIEAIYPLDPIIVHIGTSIYADKALAEHGLLSIDGNYVPKAIWIDQSRLSQGYSSEHTRFTSGLHIENAIKELGMTDKSNMKIESYFNFAGEDDTVTLSGGDASQVAFRFSSNTYDGDFRYDAASGTYLKFQRGKEQTDSGDEANGAQLAFTNVVLMFADIETIPNSAGLVDVNYQSGGKGYYFTNGKYEEFIWKKADYNSNFKFEKADGTEIVFNTGKTIMCIVRNSYENTLVIS